MLITIINNRTCGMIKYHSFESTNIVNQTSILSLMEMDGRLKTH